MMGLWTNAELTTTIFCSCLPYIPRFSQYTRSKLSVLAQYLGKGMNVEGSTMQSDSSKNTPMSTKPRMNKLPYTEIVYTS